MSTLPLQVFEIPQRMAPGLHFDDYIVTGAALSAGNFVNVYNDGGTPKVRKADATIEGKEADGYVKAAAGLGASVTVYFDGINNKLSGLTPGSWYYLHTTAGGITDTPPAAAGNVVQRVGRALSATELAFEPGESMTLS